MIAMFAAAAATDAAVWANEWVEVCDARMNKWDNFATEENWDIQPRAICQFHDSRFGEERPFQLVRFFDASRVIYHHFSGYSNRGQRETTLLHADLHRDSHQKCAKASQAIANLRAFSDCVNWPTMRYQKPLILAVHTAMHRSWYNSWSLCVIGAKPITSKLSCELWSLFWSSPLSTAAAACFNNIVIECENDATQTLQSPHRQTVCEQSVCRQKICHVAVYLVSPIYCVLV